MADKKISALTAATTPLAGTEVLPIVQSGSTVKVANNDLRPKQIQSNATSGVLQVAGPAAAATRVMTTPDANFTVARTDAAQTFTGTQDVNSGDINVKNGGNVGGAGGLIGFGANNANGVMGLIKGSLANTASGADQGSLVMQTRPIGAGLQALRDVGVIGADGNITVSIGNLVVGTAGKGIDFSANTHAAGMTSELLNYYEEGTWTPNSNFGWTDSGTVTRTGTYTRVGRQVFVTIKIATSGGGSVAMNQANISNLPYTAANPAIGGWGVVSNYGATTQTQNVLVDGAVMYFTGSWPAVANYTYTATVTYTV